MTNEAAIDARGITPLEPELKAIDRIDSVRALAERAGRLSANTTAGPFFSTVGIDPRNPADRLVHLSQGGLLLERDVYLKDDDASAGLRAGYRAYLERIFTLVGRAEPAADAQAVLGVETEIARAHRLASDGGDPEGPAAPLTPSQLNSAFPGFDWVAWARPQGIDRVAGVIVVQPSFFRTFAAMAPARPLATWRAWLAARYITAMAPYVSRPRQRRALRVLRAHADRAAGADRALETRSLVRQLPARGCGRTTLCRGALPARLTHAG